MRRQPRTVLLGTIHGDTVRTRLTVTGLLLVAVAVLVGVFGFGGDDPIEESFTLSVPAGPDTDGAFTLDAGLFLPSDAAADDPRPAVLLAHGFLGDRRGFDQRARELAGAGYVVLTWSARGFGASEGQIGLADPDREIADVSRLVDHLADRPEVLSDAAGDPRVGIAGASYGGGTALLAAAADERIDAVAAAATWHSLPRALAPGGGTAGSGDGGVLKTGWASLLFTAATLPTGSGLGATAAAGGPAPGGGPPPTPAGPCGRFSEEICDAYVDAVLEGRVTGQPAEVLDRASLSGRLDDVTTPTLLLQGQDDTLFDLTESRDNAQALQTAGAPVRLVWVPGGHGEVGSGAGTGELRDEVDAWFDRWLRRSDDAAATPTFTWTDTTAGARRDADELPGTTAALGGPETLDLVPTADGRLTDRADLAGPNDPANARSVTITAPPGGEPAAISTLPGLGALGGLVPATDVPGQHAPFTSEPVGGDTTLAGVPSLRLGVEAEVSEVRLFVKLFDVAPGGETTLIHQRVTPVEIDGLPREVEVRLGEVAYRLPAGNRLRLVVATTDQAFATLRTPASLELQVGAEVASLQLPVVPTDPGTGGGPLAGLAALAAVSTVLGVVLVLRGRRPDPVPAGSASTGTELDPAGGPTAAAGPVWVSEPAAVTARGLTKRYPDGHLAVDRLDLDVRRHQVVGLLGPNGAGKTSALRMLLGLSKPTAGEIEVFGHRMRPGHPVLRRVGALVEGPGFVPELSGRANLELYWRAGGQHLDEADLPWALDVAALGPAIGKPVRTYSHGMKQRLAIAQALLGRPELLVLDEPTDGLDPHQIRAMRELLAGLGERGHTVLVSSHLLTEVEQTCTHAVVVQAGRLLAAGRVDELTGATRTVVIETDDRARARTVLAERLGAEAVEGSGAGLAVHLGDHGTSRLVVWLVDAGLAVRAVTPRGRLEDAFLDLTGDGTSR